VTRVSLSLPVNGGGFDTVRPSPTGGLTGDTKEQEEDGCIVVVPPRRIKQRVYRCDKRFHWDEISDLYEQQEAFGLVFVDGLSASAYRWHGADVSRVARVTSVKRKAHKKGGQSQNRYQRLTEEKREAHLKRVENLIRHLPDFRLVGVVGIGPCKKDVCRRLTEDSRYVELPYADLNLAVEHWKPNPLSELELKYLDEFETDLATDGGLAVYGPSEVESALESHLLARLFVSDAVPVTGEDRVDTVIRIPEHHRLVSMYGSRFGWRYFRAEEY